ncbi:MAG: type VI secretion system tip protein VgrG [Rhodospirillales bacterium]|nr:MAG: type VI secretion system tip protein VgrG [Rhodospirillales bacterium]
MVMPDRSLTQDRASLGVTTPLGKDQLILEGMDGKEQLSRPFLFRLAMAVAGEGLDPEAVVGQAAHVTLLDGDGNQRVVHGLVTRLIRGRATWHAELRPWLWLLRLTSDNRIFQNKTVPDILQDVFDELGFSDYRNALSAQYGQREYCVQYRETTYDFVHRLMAEDGIAYYFEHAEDAHTLVLVDDASALQPCPNAASVPFKPRTGSRDWLEDCRIDDLSVEKQVVPDGFQADDYNFETPATELKVSVSDGDGDFTVYDYPGGYTLKDQGDSVAKRRLNALRSARTLISGASPVRGFAPGYKFTLTGHPFADGDLVLRTVRHRVGRNEYANTFIAQEADAPLPPPRAAPRPRVGGSQTARVVGPSGKEIWTDQYGRIKVQFHWDQQGQGDENSSCWIRVSHGWAGKSWGTFVLPRIGQEVVVSFLDGDPDRPIVTGCVYNGDNPVPYGLPDEQTKTTIRSESSTGGDGYNEFRFEDKAGEEEVYLHAQKDLTTEVEENRTTTVTKDDSLTVSEGNRTVSVDQGNEELTVQGQRTLTITGEEKHTNAAGFTHEVGGNCSLIVTGNLLIRASGSVTISAGAALTVNAGAQTTMTTGLGMDLVAATSLQMVASAAAELKGGMVTIQGGMVKIN